MGVSDWFQAWLALIESPQEAPGNHRPTPELFHQKQDGAEICRMPSSFSRIPIEVQYILGTYYLWNWIDFCHQLHPSMAKQLRVMDHFVCHSVLPKTQNMAIFISQVCIPLFFHQDKRSRGIIACFCIIRNNINTSLKHSAFILYPYVFSFVTSRSFWNAVILPCVKILNDSCNGIWVSSRGWRFSALPLRCDQFLWARRAGGQRDPEDAFAPEWSQLPQNTVTRFDNQLTVPSWKLGVQTPRTSSLLSTRQPWKSTFL